MMADKKFKVILAQKLRQAMLQRLHQCLHHATSTLSNHPKVNKDIKLNTFIVRWPSI